MARRGSWQDFSRPESTARAAAAAPATPRAQQQVRVQRTKGGKLVTATTCLDLP